MSYLFVRSTVRLNGKTTREKISPACTILTDVGPTVGVDLDDVVDDDDNDGKTSRSRRAHPSNAKRIARAKRFL